MKNLVYGMAVTICLVSLFSCTDEQTAVNSQTKEVSAMSMNVQSPVFEEGGMIPAKYTSDGANVSPPLNWSGVPEESQSIVLIVDDPDAPVGTFVHWVLYGLPADVTELQEDVPDSEKLDNGALQGENDFNKIGYGGPSPPSGTHRYFFKVYALDCRLDLKSGATKRKVEKKMKGHVLAEGELMGKYARQHN